MQLNPSPDPSQANWWNGYAFGSIPGPTGSQGQQGSAGNPGPAGPSTIGAPNPVAAVLDTAFQASAPTKPAIVSLTLNSSAALTISGGQVHAANILIGPDSAVLSDGVPVGKYVNGISGALVIGLNITNQGSYTVTFALPIGWFYAVKTVSGTPQIISAYDQALG